MTTDSKDKNFYLSLMWVCVAYEGCVLFFLVGTE